MPTRKKDKVSESEWVFDIDAPDYKGPHGGSLGGSNMRVTARFRRGAEFPAGLQRLEWGNGDAPPVLVIECAGHGGTARRQDSYATPRMLRTLAESLETIATWLDRHAGLVAPEPPRRSGAEYYSVDGYWKDDRGQFSGYIVSSMDSTPGNLDPFCAEDIFFYGLDSRLLEDAIAKGVDTAHDFVITAYRDA